MPRVEWSFLMPAEDHRSVKRFLANYHYRLTPWGQIFFFIMMVSLSISSVGTQISAYLMASFLSAYALTAYLMSIFFRPKINAYRILPPAPEAGGSYVYKVVVTNTGKKPIRNLAVFEQTLPYGIYTDMKNPQFKNTVDWLDAGEQKTLTLAFRTPRRGVFELMPLIAGSSFPSGIFYATVHTAHKDRLVVYPKVLRHMNFQTNIHNILKPEGSTVSFKAGDSNEFVSTRDYRQGDRFKDIHWTSSARMNKLIVKEYVKEYFLRVGLFIDTQLGRYEKHKYFEGRLSLCAGIADMLGNSHYIVDVFLSDENCQHTQIGQGFSYFNHLLEFLSNIEGDIKVDFKPSSAHLEEYASKLSTLILFLKDWDEPRATFVKSLKNMGFNVKSIIIRDKLTTLSFDEDVSVYTTKQLKSWQ